MIYDNQQRMMYEIIEALRGARNRNRWRKHGEVASLATGLIDVRCNVGFNELRSYSMELTIFTASAYAVLLIANFATASVSHHVKAMVPLWVLANTLNKIAAMCVLPAILIDIVRLVF